MDYDLRTYMKILCASRNISQRELCRRLGFSNSFLGLITMGRRPLLESYYNMICEALELDKKEKEMLGKYIEKKGTLRTDVRQQINIYKETMIKLENEIYGDIEALEAYGGEEKANLKSIKELYLKYRKSIEDIFNITKDKLEALESGKRDNK